MEMFVVSGGSRLAGTVRASGAKNAALPILAATLAADGESVVHGVPDLVDTRTMQRLLASLGVDVSSGPGDALRLNVVDEAPHVADYDLVRRMRAGVCVLGPLLARRGRARVSLPGGCNIGDRPIDLHLRGLAALGADIRVERGYVRATAKRLVGTTVRLGGPAGSTVTGTANVMTAACLAAGTTTIEFAAREPEIVDLGRMLNAMGARIEGLGTPLLRIEGVERLHGTEHTLIPDRIEAGTLMIAAAITRGRVRVENVVPEHLDAVLGALRRMRVGVSIEEPGSPDVPTAITIDATGEPLRPTECVAEPHPGLPTDVQAQLTALLTTVPGIGVVTDRVFPDRFLHTPELVRLGANVRRDGGTVIVNGVDRLYGANVMASDLRASAALVLAGLAAEGETIVRRIYHLDRGYERLERKLVSLGADVCRVEDRPENVPAGLRAA